MLNQTQLIGNVGQDPDVMEFEGGHKLASFSIATNRRYKNKSGEVVTETEWHNVQVWGKLAEVVEKYVKKGDRLYVCGESRTRSYEKQYGDQNVTHYITEVIVNNLIMLSNKEKGEGTKKRDTSEVPPPPVDDLPF